MKSYENTVIRLNTVACLSFVCVVLFVALVLPDYHNAQECTCNTYATITNIDTSTIPYTVTLHGDEFNADGVVQVHTFDKSLHVGDYILVEYTEDRTCFRIPNFIY